MCYLEEGSCDGWVPGATLGFVDVVIDSSDSLVPNPFGWGPVRRLCMAFDELLTLILSDDLDIDRLALDFDRSSDGRRFTGASISPAERRVLVAIAAKHDVLLLEDRLRCFSFAGVRSWISFHLLLMRSGASIRLLGPRPNRARPLWSSYGLSLVGALLWVGCRLHGDPATVRWRPVMLLLLA
jgi:hypothetical protein